MIPAALSVEESPSFSIEQWVPNRAQSKFLGLWLCKQHPVISLQGGWGVGKTRLVAYLMQASAEAGDGDGFYVTDSFSRGARTIAKEVSELLEPLGWQYFHSFKGAQAPHWMAPEYGGKRCRVWVLSWKRPSTKAASANSLEGPDCAWGIADECNQMSNEEMAVAMLGRVRSGIPGRIALLGKPTFDAWWLKFARERGGVAFSASSACNREHLPDYDRWRATLSPREVRENLDCHPSPPDGAVFEEWEALPWPQGNLTDAGWRPEPWMRTWVTMDFGVRHPAALVISHDPRIGDGGVDVIWSEAVPDRASVFDVCAILRRGRPDLGIPGVWPANRNDAPVGTIPINSATGDRAGRNMRDDALMSSALSDVQASPAVGGLGMRMNITDDPARIQVNAGIKLLWRLILDNGGQRRLLCSHKLWHDGGRRSPRSFAQCILGYRWARGSKDVPAKDGKFDHTMDALRYWAINTRWPQDVGISSARGAFRNDFTPTSKPKPGIDR